MPASRQILRMLNPVMEYAWGSSTFIPELLGRPTPARKPAAELWMGAHPRAPSTVETAAGPAPLDRLIREDPGGNLGPEADNRFGARLPFLLKVLAVDRPLSIQAHPDRARAGAGYRREEPAGIPVADPGRSYRDAAGKPELLAALTPFEALCGFRAPEEITAAVSDLGLDSLLPEAKRYRAKPEGENLRRLFRALLALPAAERRTLLAGIPRPDRGERGAPPAPDPIGDWIVRLLELHPDDIGVVGPFFLNLVRLQPEEAVFLAPGELHAYLRGAGVEIMAASDNVLRGGLTVKHVDGEGLSEILSCRCGPVSAFSPRAVGEVEWVYPSPAEEFQLSRLLPSPSAPFRSGGRRGPEIVFCYRGKARAADEAGTAVELSRGASAFIPFAAGEYEIRGGAVIYRAALPAR